MRIVSYHAHAGPPWRCHGGATRQDLAQALVEACIAVAYPTTVLVESLDSVEDCYYRNHTDVMMIGQTDDRADQPVADESLRRHEGRMPRLPSGLG